MKKPEVKPPVGLKWTARGEKVARVYEISRNVIVGIVLVSIMVYAALYGG